jgi:hypothetical protein
LWSATLEVMRGLIIEINIRLGIAPKLISNKRDVNQGTGRKNWSTCYCFGHRDSAKLKIGATYGCE